MINLGLRVFVPAGRHAGGQVPPINKIPHTERGSSNTWNVRYIVTFWLVVVITGSGGKPHRPSTSLYGPDRNP